jgi:nucleotide-binding universal stress UspA family protein
VCPRACTSRPCKLRERARWEAEEALLAARDHLERAAYRYLQHTIPHCCVPVAYPARAILDAATDWGIDLIAMTPSGTGGGEHSQGGVAAHVLGHTPVPMFCLPGAGVCTPAHEAGAIRGGMARPEPALAGAC